MAGDPRSQAAGRTGGTQPPVAPEWLQPNPGQTPSDGGLLLEESNAHKIEVANSIAAAQKVAKDVAATNIEDLKKKNAGLLQQGQQFQEYGPGWWESLKNVGADVVNEMGTGATGFLTGALAAGKDTLAPSQRDPLLRTAYLSAPNAQTFNAELAVNRALSQHPELIAKPYLLLNAAMKDMDAHDVKYMDVMDTMMKYYQAAILNPKGLQNAAEAINNRIKQTPATQMQNTIGTAVKDVANVLGKGGQLFGEAQRWVEKSFIELGGGTATEKQVDGKPMLAVTPGDNFLGQATGFVTNQFGMATEAVKKTWEIADSNMFGIQHAIRTEDHIRRTQGDQAANEYLSVWFGTAVALNLFGKGFALMLRGMEQTALRRTLEKAGVSTDVATNLLQLQQMAKVANMDDAKWIRLVRASQDWLMHQPQNVRIPMFSRYMELGKALPEEEALTASLSKRVGNTITQYGTPVGRLVKDAATYGQRHWHIPLNLELSAQLLGTTNNFGFGNNWDKAWAATADGNNYIDPITHRKKAVSFGRVVADTAGLDENTWWYNRVSGALDFLSWFEFDPFQSILAPLAETKQLANEGVLSRSYPGQGMRSASDVYRVFATRQKARDFASHVVQLNRKAEPYFESAAQTARMNRENKIQRTVEKWRKQGLTQAQIDARLLGSSSLRPLTEEEAGRGAISISPQASSISQLIKSYPHLLSIVRSDELASGDNFIVMLSHAKTEEDVINIFVSAAEANGYLNAFRAPSRSRFLSFKDYLRNQTEKAVIEREQKLFSKGKYGDAAQVGINSRAYRAFISVRPQFWDEFSKWSNKVVRVGAPESLDMLSRVWRASGVNPLTVDLLVNRLAMSRDAKEWGTVYTNWVKDTFAVYVDSMLLQRLNMGVLNTKQATQIRNIVNKELQNAIDELGNPFGGGAANRVYSGADINNIVDPKRPFPNSNGMEDTAGITSKNEHYLAIPDYTQVEKIIGDMEKFLRSKDGEASIFQTIKEMIAKPFDDKLAEIQKQQDDIVANLAKTAKVAPMKMPESNLSPGAQYAQNAIDQFYAKGNTIEIYGGGGQTNAETIAKLEKEFAPLKKAGDEKNGRTKETLRAGTANAAFETFKDSGMVHLIVARNAQGEVIGALDFNVGINMLDGSHSVEIHLIGSTEKNVGPALEHALAQLSAKQLKEATLTTDIAHGSTPYHAAMGREIEPLSKPFLDARGTFTAEQMAELASLEPRPIANVAEMRTGGLSGVEYVDKTNKEFKSAGGTVEIVDKKGQNVHKEIDNLFDDLIAKRDKAYDDYERLSRPLYERYGPEEDWPVGPETEKVLQAELAWQRHDAAANAINQLWQDLESGYGNVQAVLAKNSKGEVIGVTAYSINTRTRKLRVHYAGAFGETKGAGPAMLKAIIDEHKSVTGVKAEIGYNSNDYHKLLGRIVDETGMHSEWKPKTIQEIRALSAEMRMSNRERLDALAMDRLVTSGKSWLDMESKIKELDRRVAANKASRGIEPQDKPIKGFQQDVIDRLRREISMRGETVGLNYEQIKQLQSFADMIGEDMFEGVRLRTISRAKGADSTIVGSYEFANKLINLYSRAVFDEKGINRTLIHELWHHLSTFLPQKEIAVFSKNLEKARQRFLNANDMAYWRRTIDDEYIKNLEEMAKFDPSLRPELKGIKYIDKLIEKGWHKDVDKIIWDSLPDAYAGGIENYRLTNIDEYFAETMYDRTMSKLSSTNPIVEFAYNIISKIIQGIGKFSDAFASRRVFDNFINQRYAASNGVDLNLSLRSIPKNRYQREVNMALNPQHNDPTWRALEEKRIDLEEQRKQALEEAMGNNHIFSTPEKMIALPMNGIYGFHSWVRRAFIDNFFRKLVLATGSFSMRVSASEAIANAFRLGPVEYSKASLFSHIDTAAKAYEKMYKTKVTAEEMPFLQRWVYDRLRNITGDDIEFYTESLAKEGVRLGKRIKRDFLDGLTSGKAYDELVQIITKDALVNGSAFLGISADEAGVYGGGADSVESQMRNITSGRGTGQWHKQTNVNNKTMVDMTKVLSDIATDNLSRGAAIILDNYFNPQKFIGWNFAKRLDHAMEDVRQFVRMSVNKNPREYDNMKRRFGVLPQTRDKIADDIRSENGLSASSPIQGSLLDELKDRLQKVNPLDEWANATVQHILWATHGRGPTGGFDFPNMGGRVFHRRILSALARGEYPQTAKELEALYLSPDLEHARVMQHQKSTKGKGGAQAKAYHDILYNRNFKYSDDSTFDPLEVSAQSTASTPGELEALKKKLINMHKPVKLKTPSRAKRQFRREMSGISRRYDDIHGQATSLFPDNIPGQDYNELSGISGLADKMSNFVHDTFSRKIIDSVSRRPLYYLELQRQLKFLKPFVDSGAITEDTAFTIAQSRAITIGIKYVHNPQDRLIFEQWSRAYAPFWFAENQAFKRMGRMALENPAGFEQYMLAQLMFMYTAKHSTENLDNQNGVLIPTSVAGGQMFTSALRALSGGLIGASGNVPIGLTGSLTSLNSVFPWNDPTGMHTGSPMALVEHLRPEFSPVVSAPLKIMQTLRPYGFKIPLGPQVSTTGLAESVLGEVGANADWLQMFMPNPALRSLIQEAIAIPSFFDSSGNVSSFTRQIDSIQYGLIGQYYADKTNEIKDKARKAAKASWYSEYGSLASAFRVNYPDEYNHYIDYKTTVFMRTGYEDRQNPALGFKSVDEYWNDRKNVTDLIRQTRSAAMAIYLGRTALSFFSPLSLQTTKVNPEVTAYLRSLTKAGMDTKKLRKVLVEHPEYISFALAHQSASGLGIPLEATFAVQMFQEHNADLFQKGDNLAGLYAFTPWSKKYDEYSSKEYQIQDVTGVRKKLSMQDYVQYLARQTGNFFVYDYIPKTDPEDDYGATQDAQRYGSVNVAWSQSQGDAAKNRAKAFREIESILKIPGIAKREGFNKTVPVIKRIIELYHSYQDDLNMAAPGNSQALNEEWVAELESIKKQHPEATYSIETLFKNMKLRDVK